VLIGIETTDAGNFEALFQKLDAAGFNYRDITNDQTLAQFLI
jgi:threonine dehydratase